MGVIVGDHPIGLATTSPLSHYPYDIQGVQAYLRDVGISKFALHPFKPGVKRITLGSGVWLGQNILVKQGFTIDHGAVVAVGSVVVKHLSPYAIVGGVPARIIAIAFPSRLLIAFSGPNGGVLGPICFNHWMYASPRGFPINSMKPWQREWSP